MSSDRIKSRLIVFIVRSVGRLPLSLARRFGAFLAALGWRRQDRNSRVTSRNIQVCFPHLTHAEQSELAKKSMIETGRLAGEICFVWRRDTEELRTLVNKVEGEQEFENARLSGEGLIVLAPHIGNWELLGLWLAKRCRLMCLYQPPKQRHLESLVKSSRERDGTKIVPTDRRGIASLLKHLKNGDVTGILPDQTPDEGSGEFAKFFSRDAYTITLIHGLLQRTNCKVIFGVMKREDTGFSLHFLPAAAEIYDADLATSVRALNEGVERCIALAPEQYQWEYKRFKMRPQGAPNIYNEHYDVESGKIVKP